jgi:type I restriction enzyme R subunit
LKDRWDELVEALRNFVTEVEAGRQQDDTGLDPETQAPFLGVLRREVLGEGVRGVAGEVAGSADLPPERLMALCQVTVELVEHVQQEIRLVGFWENPHAQTVLRKWILQYLDAKDVLPIERLPEVADRLVELAKANHRKLTR